MTVKDMPGGGQIVSWEPGDPVDWIFPNSTWHGHEFCGNCGWDAPGCGCPRDCDTCRASNAYCGHLDQGHDPADYDDEDGYSGYFYEGDSW